MNRYSTPFLKELICGQFMMGIEFEKGKKK